MPLKVHYFFSGILYFFLCKVFKYRSSTVWINLSRSFPEKKYEELEILYRDFYHSLCDIMVESIWAFTASRKRIGRHIDFADSDILNEAYGDGKNVMMVMGHRGNWEFYTGLPDLQKTYGLKMDNEHFFYIYKKMSDKLSDKLLYSVRSKHHSCSLIEMQSIVRKMLRQKEQGGIYFFLCDQYPGKATGYKTTFLNQPTNMITGPEQISRKLGLPVVFFDIVRVKRGYYRSNMVKICDDASQTPEGFISQEYTRLLESKIKNNPAGWLWSHRRWK